MRVTTLPSGETIPVLGQGTWRMGEDPTRRGEEITALQAGIDLGMALIDTAEMYGDGQSERLVGEAIAGRRDRTFLVSKVLPDHASHAGVISACERSLRRMDTDCIDLYLLHWRGAVPLAETVDAFAVLQRAGKIRHWGVSNFDVDDMDELMELPEGQGVATNQVLYNVSRRGIEFDLLPWCAQRHLPTMAYSPIEQGRLLEEAEIQRIAAGYSVTPAQLALAWVLRRSDVIAIPKAGNSMHVRENHAVIDLQLSPEDLAALDRRFPPPVRARPLEMI